MAKERGSFEVFDAELEKNNPMIIRLSEVDSELAQLLKEGRRNIALTTVAPAGCLVENSKIKTDKGELSLIDLFLVNGYDLESLRGVRT